MAAFASLRRMVYPGIDRSHDGILVVRRDSEKPNMWNGVGEGCYDVGTLAINMTDVVIERQRGRQRERLCSDLRQAGQSLKI